MAGITNEQKLYVLLDNIREKSEYEQGIWGIIYNHVSPDDAWKESVAELLVKSAYLDRGYGFSNQESMVVYSVTKQGRRQIPILWNGSTLKREHENEVKALKKESSFEVRHKKINKFLWILWTAIVSSLVTNKQERCCSSRSKTRYSIAFFFQLITMMLSFYNRLDHQFLLLDIHRCKEDFGYIIPFLYLLVFGKS